MSVVAWFELWVGVGSIEDVAAARAALEDAGEDPFEETADAEVRAYFDSDGAMVGYGAAVFEQFEGEPRVFDVAETARLVALAEKKAAARFARLGISLPLAVWAHAHKG